MFLLLQLLLQLLLWVKCDRVATNFGEKAIKHLLPASLHVGFMLGLKGLFRKPVSRRLSATER